MYFATVSLWSALRNTSEPGWPRVAREPSSELLRRRQGRSPERQRYVEVDAHKLAGARRLARQTRPETNRGLNRDACRTEPVPLSPSEPVASETEEPQ